MSKIDHITPRFVDFIPSDIEDGVLYISEKYKTASHMCCCGCRNKVVTPLKSGQWSLTISDDRAVSLAPSIGNWNFPCKSHYWIRGNMVDWSTVFTEEEIAFVQERDREAVKQRYQKKPATLWQKILNWLARWFRW